MEDRGSVTLRKSSSRTAMQFPCCNSFGWQCFGVLPLPGLGFGNIIAFLEVARLRLFIEEKILCCLIFRANRMENITSSIYDVISKGKVASTFSYYK